MVQYAQRIFISYQHPVIFAQKENLVFDALNDPIMGNMIESTRSKCKKFKPWLMIGILLISIK